MCLRRKNDDTRVSSLQRTVFCPFIAMSFPAVVFTFYKVFSYSYTSDLCNNYENRPGRYYYPMFVKLRLTELNWK